MKTVLLGMLGAVLIAGTAVGGYEVGINKRQLTPEQKCEKRLGLGESKPDEYTLLQVKLYCR